MKPLVIALISSARVAAAAPGEHDVDWAWRPRLAFGLD
jgi:hypothetical protein